MIFFFRLICQLLSMYNMMLKITNLQQIYELELEIVAYSGWQGDIKFTNPFES